MISFIESEERFLMKNIKNFKKILT